VLTIADKGLCDATTYPTTHAYLGYPTHHASREHAKPFRTPITHAPCMQPKKGGFSY